MAKVYLDSLIRVSPDAIVATDKEGKITLFNEAAERLMGYKAEKMIGKPAAEFYSKEEVARELMQEIYKRKGEVANYETAVRTKSGEIVPVLISARQLKDEKGEVTGTVGFVKDISEKKRVEEELRSRNMELAVLNEISMLLSQSFDLEEGLNKSLDIILKMMSLDAGLAYLIDESNKLLILSAHRGVSEEFLMQEKKFPLTLSNTLAGKIAQSEELVVIDDYAESPLPVRKLLVKEGVKSAVFIPFLSKKKRMGTMIVATKDYRKFTEQEVKSLSSVSHQMGIAIQNVEFLKELERERDFNKMLVDNMGEGVVFVNAEGKREFMNKRYCEIMGYSPEEVIGSSYLDFVHPDDIEYVKREDAKRKEGHISTIEYRRIRKDGTVIYTQSTGVPLFDRNGKYLGTISIFVDMTERKRMEQEIIRHNQELSAINEIDRAMSQSLSQKEIMDIALEKAIEITGMDRGMIRLWDENKEELVMTTHKGIPSSVKYPERLKLNEGFAGAAAFCRKSLLVEDITTDPRTMEIAIKAGLKSVATIPLLSKDKLIGTLQVTSYTLHSFHPRDKEFLATIGNQIGIFIENAKLYDQLRFLASIPTYSPYGLFTVDNNRIITSWNKGAEDIYGWKEEEIVGRSIRIIAPDDDVAEAQERNFEKLIKEGILRAVEIERMRKDGSKIPVELTSWAIKDEEEKIMGYVGSFRELTENKKMQQELDKRQREIFQAEKLASIGSLAAGARHEILNPLNIISAYSQFLLPKYNLDPTLSKALKTIDEQCQRINKITRGLILFSRKGEMKRELVDLKEVILSTLALVEEGMRLDNIKIIKRVKGPLILEADGDQLSQVILGLINNARDALHGKAGTIEISTDTVERNGEKKVLLSMADTGEGIKEEYLGKIFDPFFTTKPVGKGTGLGLSVAYGIIADHGGSIELESKVGEGTTFKIFLPLSKEQLTTNSMKNILIIDDEPLTCELYKGFFEAERYRVDVAYDGSSGLSKLREGKYSLVLLDIRMPRMSGLEVLKKLKEEGIETKVIIITGIMERDVERKCLSLGVAHFLTKPISLQNLKEVIGKTIE